MSSQTSFSLVPILIQTSSDTEVLAHIPFSNPTNHPDVIWFNPTESLTIEMIRGLKRDVLTRPYQEEHRIFVLQNLELATVEAQQALLKLLEEPPAHIRFILTTEYPSMVLGTILSRVQLELSDLPEKPSRNDSINYATELRDISFKTLADRLNWAAKPELQEKPVAAVLSLLGQQIVTMEKEPTPENIGKLKTLNTCLEFLRAKTNTKLSLEWLALHF